TTSQTIISDALLPLFQLYLGITESVFGLLGLTLNIVTIIVFIRLGLSDSTNISLTGLAVANIGVSLTMMGYGALNNPLVLRTVSNVETIEAVRLLLLGIPNVLFSRIAGLITAFISLERFLCVAWPLHVKSLVTKRRTISVIFGVYMFMVSSHVPIWLANQIGQRLNPQINVMVVGVISSQNAEELRNVTITITVAVQMTSFAVVAVSTLCMINALRRITEWRKVVISQESRKEKQLVKMAILISAVFIVCSFPSVLANTVMPFFKEFRVQGREKNFFMVSGGFCFTCQLVNATLNTFVYLAMSSRFRDNVYVVFVCQTRKR
ncbi:unnamed protein product, partial [Lymnaea stagnalis]